MDPFLSWIRVDDSANLAINSPPKPKPPSSALSHGAAIYGLFGHEAQFRAAFKALSPTPAPRKRVLTTEITPDMRSKARRAAFDEEEDMSCVSYDRAEEALRYRALWLDNRAAWLIASKSRWRAIRAQRRQRLLQSDT
jgi:hypothetical protein